METKSKNNNDYQQISVMEFIETLANLKRNDPTKQSKIIQFPPHRTTKKRKQALKRVISYSKSLNW